MSADEFMINVTLFVVVSSERPDPLGAEDVYISTGQTAYSLKRIWRKLLIIILLHMMM